MWNPGERRRVADRTPFAQDTPSVKAFAVNVFPFRRSLVARKLITNVGFCRNTGVRQSAVFVVVAQRQVPAIPFLGARHTGGTRIAAFLDCPAAAFFTSFTAVWGTLNIDEHPESDILSPVQSGREMC